MDIETDILVIGAGVAGVTAALAAARAGARVLVITDGARPNDSNTAYAQGGIIAGGLGDTPDLLARDIMAAGAGLCEPDAVNHLAKNGPPLLHRLLVDELDVDFSRDEDGGLDLTEEAAHSMPRIAHAEDLTGRAIIRSLLEAAQNQENLTIRRRMMAVDLLNVADHSANLADIYRTPTCVGAYVLDIASGEVKTVVARQTILATGGLGQLYLHTTNPRGARGDGIALAYRFGARLLNMEYIQFHPTALHHRDADSFLISESLRGEGARLVNAAGEEFMSHQHERGSLAPRDVVARGIHNELLDSDEPCVYLDITHKDRDWLKSRFPHIYETCARYGIDIATDPIPVVPAAHYLCGGVAVDLLGRTNIPRLRAAGEVACTGLHGANRLASTSLLEGLLWGWEAGSDSARQVLDSADRDFRMPPIRPFEPEADPVDPALVNQDWRTIQYTMWNYVGLVRTARRMYRAMAILRELQYEILSFYRNARPVASVLGLRNGITAALAVLYAAQRNRQSRGCHYLEQEK